MADQADAPAACQVGQLRRKVAIGRGIVDDDDPGRVRDGRQDRLKAGPHRGAAAVDRDDHIGDPTPPVMTDRRRRADDVRRHRKRRTRRKRACASRACGKSSPNRGGGGGGGALLAPRVERAAQQIPPVAAAHMEWARHAPQPRGWQVKRAWAAQQRGGRHVAGRVAGDQRQLLAGGGADGQHRGGRRIAGMPGPAGEIAITAGNASFDPPDGARLERAAQQMPAIRDHTDRVRGAPPRARQRHPSGPRLLRPPGTAVAGRRPLPRACGSHSSYRYRARLQPTARTIPARQAAARPARRSVPAWRREPAWRGLATPLRRRRQCRPGCGGKSPVRSRPRGWRIAERAAPTMRRPWHRRVPGRPTRAPVPACHRTAADGMPAPSNGARRQHCRRRTGTGHAHAPPAPVEADQTAPTRPWDDRT